MNLHRLSGQQRDALEFATEHGEWVDFRSGGPTAASLVRRELGTQRLVNAEGRARYAFTPTPEVAAAVRLGALRG